MKKFISLLLVLAMVLSMSAVAIATTGGQLQDGDNTIELPWDSVEASTYTYTATQTGTLYIMATEFYSAIGDYDYTDNSANMDEWEWYTQLTVNGQALEGAYYGGVEVVAGQTYTIAWSHLPEMIAAKWYNLGWRAVINLSYSGEDIPQPGSESLPVELFMNQCPTESIEIAPGATAYYLLYDFGGAVFTVTGENAYVVTTSFDMEMGGTVVTRYESEDGVVTVPVANYHTTIQIGNAGEEGAVFALDCYYALGTRMNPAQLVIGQNVAEAENWDGYCFTWTAQCNGTLTLNMPERGWVASVRNETADGEELWYDSGFTTTITVEVAKGDVVLISVNSFTGLTVPGGDVVFTASESYHHHYVDGSCEHCGAAEETVVPGDVNGDGAVNTRDARLVLRYIAGLVDKTAIDLAAADFNGDGAVNTRDARGILRFIAGLG